ncbi:MAG: diguanylate cyclase, partial [Moorea sp. SIO2I5]|nr:diguanylate cyclase [Moorena sp. SIO2I5]
MARYALVIGISEYDDEHFPMLTKAYTDAVKFAEILKQDANYDQNYPVEPIVLKGTVTQADLSKEIETFLTDQATRNEAIIYFTGHGFTEANSRGKPGQAFLATSDCIISEKDGLITRQAGGFGLNDLSEIIEESQVSQLVVLLDACHSGFFLEKGLTEKTFYNISSKMDYYLIASCRKFEKSYVRKRDEHSIFTKALIKGLAPENADHEGYIYTGRLYESISGYMREIKDKKQEVIYRGGGHSIFLLKHQVSQQIKAEILEPIRYDNGDILCPYQGLEVFDYEKKEFFFGRKQVIEQIKKTLDSTNFVPIIGASGSGKSSVVRAGLIPWLEEEGNWHILAPIKPGIKPLNKLFNLFNNYFECKREKQIEQLIENGDKHPQGLIELTKQLPDTKQFILIVDQFEEVFTVCSDEQKRQRFIELLTQVVTVSDCRLKVVTTMRADFLSSCLDYSKLTQLIQTQNQLMPPLEGANLEAAIVKPAIRQGYRLEKGLIGEIMTDVGKEKGSLPLLEFALTQLWDKRDQGQNLLTLKAYNQIGSLTGALNRHADQIYQYQQDYEEFPGEPRDEQQKEWIRRIFLRLVRTGEGTKDTRQRQPKAKLLSTIELD